MGLNLGNYEFTANLPNHMSHRIVFHGAAYCSYGQTGAPNNFASHKHLESIRILALNYLYKFLLKIFLSNHTIKHTQENCRIQIDMGIMCREYQNHFQLQIQADFEDLRKKWSQMNLYLLKI